jgi:hypothetical protein
VNLKTTVGGLVVLVVSLAGCGELEVPEDEGEGSSALLGGGVLGDFSAAYVGCDEFAGVGVVPLANVAALVPEDYTIIEPAPGLAVVVAQAGACDAITVNGNWAQPGVFAQFGVAVVPPLTPGNGDFYQIFFTTTHLPLAARLALLGVNARYSHELSYEIAAGPTLSIDVPKPDEYAFLLDGPITLPDPSAPGSSAVFNYYAKTAYNGNVLQQNAVQGIRFGEGSGVTLTAVGAEMEDIVGGQFLTFPFFSSPEIFDQADLSVQTDAF